MSERPPLDEIISSIAGRGRDEGEEDATLPLRVMQAIRGFLGQRDIDLDARPLARRHEVVWLCRLGGTRVNQAL